jgi:FAD/FMN-containing dehydrogenase
MPANPQAVGADRSLWNVVVGFEGFSETVDYQRDKCSGILEKGRLKVVEQFDYPVHQGAFAGIYEQLAQSSFILRGDFLLNRVAGFLKSLDDNPALANVFLDFGCGRILAGLDELNDEQWHRMCSLAAENDGHLMLEKAPDDFRKVNDVFGMPSPAWKVMHKIKAELDPDSTFAPGRLPGKV